MTVICITIRWIDTMSEGTDSYEREDNDAYPHGSTGAAACAKARGGLCPRLHGKGRHAALAGGAGQLLQRTDPAKSQMGVRRRIRGFWADRDEGNAPGISADAEGMPRRKDRPDSGQVHFPFRPKYAGAAEYGARAEGAGHRRLF